MTVNKDNQELFDGLVDGLKEGIAFAKGEDVKGVKVTKYKRRRVNFKVAIHFSAEEIKEIRVKVGFSQTKLAEFLNVGDSTVKNWEQGITEVGGAPCRMLEMLRDDEEETIKRFAV